MPKKKPQNPLSKLFSTYKQHNEMRRDYEFMPSTIEVLDRPPAPFSRAMLLFIIVFAAFLIGWASLAKMDIVVTAMGVVIPKGKVKVVQPLEPGIITDIHVRDGQLVKKGDLLVSMDNRDSLTDINTIKLELAKSELITQRLNAQLHNDVTLFSPPADAGEKSIKLHHQLLEQSLAAQKDHLDTLTMEIQRCNVESTATRSNFNHLTESLPLSRELYDKKGILAQRQLISNAELLQAQIDMNDTQYNLLAAQNRIAEIDARLERAKEELQLAKTEYQRDILSQLTEARSKRLNLQDQLTKAENRQAHFDLKAPTDGVVQQLAINTIGGVVTAAQPLMVIVPTDSGLEIEAKVLNKDIGFILSDQDVSVKVAAYPFTKYGDLDGKIQWVARDAVMDEALGPNYPILVTVDTYRLPNTVNGKQGIITPGMTVTADIKVGQRRVIDYFLGPIFRYKDKSLREI